MVRLPQPGGDNGNWGAILNDFLTQSHDTDGSLKDGVISEAKLDSGVQTKLNAAGASGVTSVNTRTGAVTLTSSDVGLANVNNTSDANKPISTATQTALNAKAPLASPTFTGTVTVPTPSNAADAATKSYVDTKSSGAVAATNMWINVMAAPYSATGDNSTDDTAAIQAAIDACAIDGTVFFPPGLYRVTSPLHVPAGVTLHARQRRRPRDNYDGAVKIGDGAYISPRSTLAVRQS